MYAVTADQACGSNFAYQHHTLKRCLDDMVDLGRTKIELWGIAPHLHIPETDAARLQQVKKLLQERELTLACLTPEQVAYPVNVASGADWLREQSVRLFLRAAEICSELESPLLFLTAGRGYEDEPAGPAWERSVQGLQAITARAAELGVVCVLEPLQRVESNLVTDVSSLERMIHDVGSPNLGVVIDTVAMAVAGDNISDYGRAFGDRVRHVHLVDGAPSGHLAWGDGTLDLNEILRGLSELDYQGALTFELFGDGSYALEPRTAVEKCLHAVDVSVAGLRAR
ncbi:protein FrlC [Arthrobacter sp. V4I6]|uniref:sugar phosphate isomerase/epimerase family protein n=1 Tax=unclassified Arthrobacter TaxID=235627 RepID=UPI0027806C68|nr:MULTISPECIES: TIM barrel protein [unclassified Arthrobacter]MDQ0819509.1 protein FrlC [Arthrobacter sp. V1I7]MDQ0853691.1 protein FrlC [Arthrobacter sp. V4I6]